MATVLGVMSRSLDREKADAAFLTSLHVAFGAALRSSCSSDLVTNCVSLGSQVTNVLTVVQNVANCDGMALSLALHEASVSIKMYRTGTVGAFCP